MKTFKGNHYQIGQQEGRLYRKNGLDLTDVKVDERLLAGQLKAYRTYCPEVVEELQGMVSAGFPENKLFSAYLTGEIAFYRNKLSLAQCTIFGYMKEGRALVGRNLDWIPEAEEHIEVFRRMPEGGNASIAISDMSIASKEDIAKKFLFHDMIDAINDKGLYCGITFAYADSWSFGVSWRDVVKMIMDDCSTVEEALEVFHLVPVCIPKNFFLADTKGEMAVVEHASGRKYDIVQSEDEVLIKTNHYLGKLKNVDTVLHHSPQHDTFIRYYTALQQLNKPGFGRTDVFPALATCSKDEKNNKTLFSLSFDMKNKKYVMRSRGKDRILKI